MRKRKRTFEVTRGQIFFALIIAAIVLTAVFEIGISVGKRRVIEAEREVTQRNDIPLRPTAPAEDVEEFFPELLQDQPDQEVESQEPVQQDNTQQHEVSEIPIGGDLPIIPPEDQPEEQSQSDEIAQYTIQVGTFGSRQNAENLVEKLTSYEYKAWLRTESSEDRILHSVLVGGFSTRDGAKQFGSLLQERLSFVTGYMVREIQE